MDDELTALLLLTDVCLDLAGFPVFLKSDRGGEFVGKVLKALNETFEIKHVFGTAYHPSSQWPVESPHKTINNVLRSFCRARPRDWDIYVKVAQWAVRSSAMERLGNRSPYEVLFGLKPQGPLDGLLKRVSKTAFGGGKLCCRFNA